jgi:pimeloyl-ACP methyl ester carboxylesterase
MRDRRTTQPLHSAGASSPARRWLVGLALVAITAAGCGGNSDTKAGGEPPESPSEATTFGTTSTSPSSSSDPAAEPSIDASFVVASDGRKLALRCWGEGSPTVLLETGGTNIEQWTGSGVVEELAGSSRVCTYDRAGTGTSDAAPDERRDADDVVADAHTLLEAADVTGPLVLVGRSFGGMVVTHYADVMPKDVLGVIVLDTPAPSAAFTEESEPELVWDFPGNTEHLDVVHGFENRFAAKPPKVDLPLLLITPVPGEATAENESFWLQVSPQASQVELPEGAVAKKVAAFVAGLNN